MTYVPTQSASDLLYGKIKLVYNVKFESGTNGTYFNNYENGAFVSESYVASPWLEDQ